MLNEALLENFRNATKLVADVMAQFDADQWVGGDASLQVPWKIAYHIVDCLDYYFREEPQKPYPWGIASAEAGGRSKGIPSRMSMLCCFI